MRKISPAIYILLLAVVIAAVLSGCSQAAPESTDKIMSPTIREVPFAGTWLLEKSITEGAAEVADEAGPLVGETVGFSQKAVMFENKIYTDIRYKAKRVNVYEYLLHKKTDLPERLDSDNGEITVTAIYSEDNFLFEFIEDSEGTKIAVIDDNYYIMKRISDELSNDLVTASNESNQDIMDDSRVRNKPPRSGLLMGVRIPVKTADGLGDYKYGTYWISSEDSSVRQVLYADDIYLPRMDGFWKLFVEKRQGNFGMEDTLNAYKVSNKQGMLSAGVLENTSERIETRSRKSIVYVGNDYVCVENSTYGSRTSSQSSSPSGFSAHSVEIQDVQDVSPGSVEKTLRTLPVDNLSNIDGIKISDMVGENGTMAMENAISDLLKNSGYEGVYIFDNEMQQKNFALYRKTGHWFFKGRIDPDGRGQLPYMDFSLNLLPPSNMVAYDVLHVPWTNMKDKLPHAIDIYTSPNKDIAVILTRNEILIYAIKGRSLSEQPVAKLQLEEGSTVIMAEWGMGDYVTSWEKSFIRNNSTRVVENLLNPKADSSEDS